MKPQLLDIKPEKIETYNCFYNNILSSIFRYWHKDIRWAFLDSFAISLQKKEQGYKISCFTDNFIYIMDEICGIDFTRIVVSNKEEGDKLIKQKLKKGVPVGIAVDEFCIPWNRHYLKHHRNHSLLIIGCDKESYYCIDGFSSNKVERIQKGIVLNHYKTIYLFKNVCERFPKTQQIHTCLRRTANTSFDFKQVFSHTKNEIEKELTNEISVADSNILFQITEIGWSRKNFHDCLFMLVECKRVNNHEEIAKLLPQLEDCYQKWTIVKNIIVRMYLLGDIPSGLEKIRLYFEGLEQIERKIKNKLLEYTFDEE